MQKTLREGRFSLSQNGSSKEKKEKEKRREENVSSLHIKSEARIWTRAGSVLQVSAAVGGRDAK